MTVETFTTRAEWLAARNRGVGGSDASVILGRSPWKGPRALWCEKKGLIASPEFPEMRAWWAEVDEPAVLTRLSKEADITVVRTPLTILWSDEFPGLFCSPDGAVIDRLLLQSDPNWPWDEATPAGAEAKSTNFRKADEWLDSVPSFYYDQVQTSLVVSRLPAWYIAARIGNDDFRWKRVLPDLAWQNENVPKLLAFVATLADGAEPPEPGPHDSDAAALAGQFPEATRPTIALPDESLDDALMLDDLNAEAKEIAEQKATLEARFKALLGVHERGVLTDGSEVRWTNTKRGRQFKRVPLEG